MTDQGVPPPPGGYGLPPDAPAKKAEAAPANRPPFVIGPKGPDTPPPAAPFRSNYYAPPPPAPARRWAIGGGIGAALLGVRLLLLCGRVASSGSDSNDYSYTPTTYPTYDPNALAAIFGDASSLGAPTHTTAAQVIAVAPDGTAYWWSYGTIEAQALGQTKVKDLVTDIDADLQPMLDSDLAVSDKNLFWLTSHSEGDLVSVPRSGGTPKVIAKGLSSPGPLVVDGSSVLLTVEGDKPDERALVRIGGSGGTPLRLASWQDNSTLPGPIAVDGSAVYVVSATVDEDYTSSNIVGRIPKSGGKMQTIGTLPAGEHVDRLVAGGKNVYFTSAAGILDEATTLWKLPSEGGSRTKVYSALGSDSALGDIAVAGAKVYFAHRVAGSWGIEELGEVQPLSVDLALLREPHFGVTKDGHVVLSTGAGVQSVPAAAASH